MGNHTAPAVAIQRKSPCDRATSSLFCSGGVLSRRLIRELEIISTFTDNGLLVKIEGDTNRMEIHAITGKGEFRTPLNPTSSPFNGGAIVSLSNRGNPHKVVRLKLAAAATQ